MRRITIASGIYQDRYGFQIRWRDHGVPRSQRFPLDTPIDVLKRFRATQVSQAAPTPDERIGSFVRDVVAFLRLRRGKKSYKSDRAHLRPWVHRFTRRSRWMITHVDIRAAIAEWEQDGYSAREIRHRVKILAQLYRTLSPSEPRTPCNGVELPTIVKTRPIAPSPTLLRDVATQLHASEIAGRLRDGKTRARYLVLATTGQRPAQVMRSQPFDVDLERGIWTVRPAKGDNGAVVYLNNEMRAAWQLFVAAKAWGDYDQRAFTKTLQRNGWPKGRDVRPYTMRHGVGLALSEAGVDLGDIQAHMGHSSPTTTRQFYVPAVPARMKAASQQLAGRFAATLFVPTPPRLVKKKKPAVPAAESKVGA